MESSQKEILPDSAQINGRADEPKGSDNTYPDVREEDNLHRPETENSANGLDSEDGNGGQDGRNIRGIGSTDMDSQHGVLRMGDQDNSTMEVTGEGMANAVASESKTNTSTVNVTTAGPDDYASDPQVGAPAAQKEAKEAAQESDEANDNSSADQDQNRANTEEEDEDIAETGTSINHQPTY